MKPNRTTKPLIWLLALSCFTGAKASAYSGGEGTKASPYVLSCKQDILELASRPADYAKSFILTDDIDMRGTVFTASVVAPDPGFWPSFNTYERLFTGCFNGNGHVIENFSIVGVGVYGFFGGVGETGRVMHLGLRNVAVAGPDTYGVGALAGLNMGDIVGCYAEGHVTGLGNVGGLVGLEYQGRILDCFSQGTVEGVDEGTGGLVGALRTGTIQRCYAACAVMSENPSGRGGLAGVVTPGATRGGGPPLPVVANSFWDIDVSGLSTSNGGQGLSTDKMQDVSTYLDVGWDFADEQTNGINDMWMHSDAGGYPTLSAFSGIKPVLLAGEGSFGKPYAVSTARELAAVAYYSFHDYAWYDLAADIDLSGTSWSVPILAQFVGFLDGHGHCLRGLHQEGSCGLFGRIERGATVANLRLEDCEVKAEEATAGCLAGENHGLISNCSATGTITGGTVTGGLAGSNTGSIWDSSFSGTAAGGQKTGGLVGENAGVVTNGVSRGTVSGGSDVGGLAGINTDTGSIRSCYSTAAVTGESQLGGLAGTNRGSVADCYARGAVAGDRCIGGLVGQNNKLVSRCYGAGAVTGSGNVGGLIGLADPATASTSSSFWDIEAAGIQISAGGIGWTQKRMQDQDTFLQAGWDFVGETTNGIQDLWVMPEGGYPELTMSLRIPPPPATRS
jgi:hypothetical protein